MKVQIDRARWNTGWRLSDMSALSTQLTQGIYVHCCLGFLGMACGATAEAMNRQTYPAKLDNISWPDGLFVEEPGAILEGYIVAQKKSYYLLLAEMNDAGDIDHDVRESWIRQAFKQWLDIDVEFMGQYSDNTERSNAQ